MDRVNVTPTMTPTMVRLQEMLADLGKTKTNTNTNKQKRALARKRRAKDARKKQRGKN